MSVPSTSTSGEARVRLEGVSKVFRAPARWWTLRKRRREPLRALHNVSFTIDHGEWVGIVGKNGAGKSTLLRLCGGLLVPDAGRVVLPAGRRSSIYLSGEDRSVFFALTGRQNLEFFARLHGLTRTLARQRSATALERVGLAEVADRRVVTYSTGMRQRLVIARALLGETDLVLLDEPMRALDREGATALRALLRAELQGVTVVLISHDADDVRTLCDRVLLLRNGCLQGECQADVYQPALTAGEGP